MGDECDDSRYTSYPLAICSVACGIALQVILKYKLSTVLPAWALGVTFAYFVIGSLLYGIQRLDHYRRYHRRAQFLMHCVVIPLLSTHFALINKYETDMSYVQLVFAVFPVLAHLINDRNQYTLKNAVVASTLAFKTFIHFRSNNPYGLTFCIFYGLFHFFIGPEQTVIDIPGLDLHTIVFVCNQYLIIRALYR